MRGIHRFCFVCALLGIVAVPAVSRAASETFAASQLPDGRVLLTLMGTTNCIGQYSLPISSYSITGSTITVASNVVAPGPPCQVSSSPVPFSATINLGWLAPGTYSVAWSENTVFPGAPPTTNATFNGTFLVPTNVSAQGVTVTPTSLSFEARPLGTSSPPVTITVTNPDSLPHALYVYRLNISCPMTGPCDLPPGWMTDFTFTTDCNQSLAPHDSCTINVVFTPTGSGARYSGIMVYPEGIFSTPPVMFASAADPQPVPTLSEWAMSVLALLLLRSGAVMAAKRGR